MDDVKFSWLGEKPLFEIGRVIVGVALLERRERDFLYPEGLYREISDIHAVNFMPEVSVYGEGFCEIGIGGRDVDLMPSPG
jgi:hypothetical protein